MDHQALIDQFRQLPEDQEKELSVVEERRPIQIKVNGRWYLDFSSNDYLGLSGDRKIMKVIREAANRFGYGSTSARLISGNTEYHQQLESYLSEYLNAESALLFSTGYMANLAFHQVLLNRFDLVIHDRLNHASLLDGAQLSRAKLIRYPHLDQAKISQLFELHGSKIKLLVSDGIFSMDGDQCDTTMLNALTEKNHSYLAIDDAHAFGVSGDGKGSYHQAGLTPSKHRIMIITFGKAIGTHGAAVIGDSMVIKALKQFAKTFVFTTACPPINAAVTLHCVKTCAASEGAELRHKLSKLTLLMRQKLLDQGWSLCDSISPIQPVLIGGAQRAKLLSNKLKEQGFWIPAIRPPTVPHGQARIRITLSAKHTQKHINSLLSFMGKIRPDFC